MIHVRNIVSKSSFFAIMINHCEKLVRSLLMMVLIATVARKYFFGDFQVDGEIDVFQKFLASGIVVNEPFEMQYEN